MGHFVSSPRERDKRDRRDSRRDEKEGQEIMRTGMKVKQEISLKKINGVRDPALCWVIYFFFFW